MKAKIKIDVNTQIPVYKQLIKAVQEKIMQAEYQEGDFLPSMNELSSELEISKETVKKAYSILRSKGVIESAHGKGFYVTNQTDDKKRILLLFDKLSTYKQVLFNSFSSEMGDMAEITIRLHNQDIELFEYFIEENLDHYDYYIITPHFPLKTNVQKRLIKIVKKIPNRKLLLLDHNLEELPGNFGSVFQSFENDIFEGLSLASDRLRAFIKLNIISMPGSLYAPMIERGIKRYCTENALTYEIFNDIDPGKINRNEVYLILNGQLDLELIELIKTAKTKGCKIGEDIGIISYNESPINEIILDGLTVFSTDFKKMGSLAAKMILKGSLTKQKCPFQLISRNTF